MGDTNALAGKHELPETSVIRKALGSKFQPSKYLDAKQSGGNKALRSRALPRMEEFCRWCFDQNEPIIIVSSGHSLWFKNFFKAFIPKRTDHHAKTHKMVNCGVVAFKLERGTHIYKPDKPNGAFKVDAKSVITVYGGFEKLKSETERPLEAMFAPKSAKDEEEEEEPEPSGPFQTVHRITRRATQIFSGTSEQPPARRRVSAPNLASYTGSSSSQEERIPATLQKIPEPQAAPPEGGFCCCQR